MMDASRVPAVSPAATPRDTRITSPEPQSLTADLSEMGNDLFMAPSATLGCTSVLLGAQSRDTPS